jgi:tetratricopeptide (TPR) repeat protein
MAALETSGVVRFAIFVVLCCLGLAAPVRAQTQWLQDLAPLYEKSDGAALALSLADRFAVAEVQTASDNQCEIRLRPLFHLDPRLGGQRLSSTTLPGQPTVNLPLQRAQGQWAGEQLVVRLQFSRSMSCRAEMSGDARKLLVHVRGQDSQQTSTMHAQMQKAKAALAAGDTATAIAIYRALLQQPPHPLQQDALEFLGVASERAGRYDDASGIYRSYLQKYPKTAEARRVKARLAGIELMTAQTPAPLREKTARDQEPMQWFGVFSNSWQQYQSQDDDNGSRTLQSVLMTDLDINGRYRSDDYDTRVVFSGGYQHDFENDFYNDHPSRLRRAYADVFAKRSGQQFRLGRQTTNGEGVLGRFDGVRYSKSVGDTYRVNALAGLPVINSRDVKFNSDAQLYGMSLDIDTPDSAWQGNVFATEQTANGFVDRRAVGGELNYLKPSYSLLTYLDYDVFFSELNTAMINGNWFGANESHTYFSADYRRSPVLTVSNALIGQFFDDLDGLSNNGFTTSELEEIALDRTAVSTSFATGYSRRVHKNYRLAIDASAWKLSATDESAGVIGFDGTDLETDLRLQLIGNDLMMKRDLVWLTLRYADLTNSNLYSVMAETRLPLTQTVRLRPRLLVYQRDYSEVDGSDTSVQPQVRLEYQPVPSWLFESDVGYEMLSSERNGEQFDRQDLFVYLRADWLF